MPVTRGPAATEIKAGGLTATVAAAVVLQHRPIIVSACTRSMREAATIRESTLIQAAAGNRNQGAVDIPAGPATAPLATGKARIIAARTTAG